MNTNNGSSFHHIWKRVYVRTGRGMIETIGGPDEALACLVNAWPSEHQKYCALAKLACVGALEGYNTLDEAREAFIAAAVDANILV